MNDRDDHPRLLNQVGVRTGLAFTDDGVTVALRAERLGTIDVASGMLRVVDPAARETADAVDVRVGPGSLPVAVSTGDIPSRDGVHAINAGAVVRLADGQAGFEPLGDCSPSRAADDEDDPDDRGLHFVGADHDDLYVGDAEILGDPAMLWEISRAADRSTAQLITTSRGAVARIQNGFGAGGYPVFGGFDSDGRLCAVYVSFEVAFDSRSDRDDANGDEDVVESSLY